MDTAEDDALMVISSKDCWALPSRRVLLASEGCLVVLVTVRSTLGQSREPSSEFSWARQPKARGQRQMWRAEAEPDSLRGRRRKETWCGGNSRSRGRYIWAWRQKQRSGIKKWGHKSEEEDEWVGWGVGGGEQQQVSQGWRAQDAARRGRRRRQIKEEEEEEEDAREETQAIESLENSNLDDARYEWYSYTPERADSSKSKEKEIFL